MIEVINLTKQFLIKDKIFGVNKGVVHAVNGVNFKIEKGRLWVLLESQEVVNQP